MVKKDRLRIARITVLLLIIFNLIFIFANSAIPTEKSSAESEAVKDAIMEVVPEQSKVGGFISDHIRHIGHFTEYASLGALVGIFIILLGKAGLRSFINSVILGQLIGFFDETVQIFSGRGPNIADVWLDTLGYFTATVIVVIVFITIRFVKKSKG